MINERVIVGPRRVFRSMRIPAAPAESAAVVKFYQYVSGRKVEDATGGGPALYIECTRLLVTQPNTAPSGALYTSLQTSRSVLSDNGRLWFIPAALDSLDLYTLLHTRY